MPNISAVQLAFASVGMSWQDAKICSVHNKDAGDWRPGSGAEHGFYRLLQAINQYDKLAVLTGPENNPARIARMLIMENMADLFSMVVAENSLCADEKIFQDSSIVELAEQSFNGNDVVILYTGDKPGSRNYFLAMRTTLLNNVNLIRALLPSVTLACIITP